MHSGLLDVLHHPADDEITGVVADRVDVDLGGIFQEAVHQHRALSGQAALFAQAAHPTELGSQYLPKCQSQMVAVVDDLHRPPTEHITRPHEHGKADPVDDGERLFEVGSRAPRRLGNPQLVAENVPLLAILGEVDRCRRRAGDEVEG